MGISDRIVVGGLFRGLSAEPRSGSVPRQVTARYTEGTLGRVLTSSPSIAARRAAVLALGVTGSFEQSNTALGRALRDNDPIVRTMAESALWAIWFRADSPENNQNLEEVRLLIGHHRVDAAVNAASRLIARAPKYAEAYNQRAIALFIQGRFAESAEDCQRSARAQPIPRRRNLGTGPMPDPAQSTSRGTANAAPCREAAAAQPVDSREHPGSGSTDRIGRNAVDCVT